jgi:hypothetical protein
MKMEPSGGPAWEPDWMQTLRAIDENIARNVDRYVRARQAMLWAFFCWALAGYWVGFGSVELVKWWAGIE